MVLGMLRSVKAVNFQAEAFQVIICSMYTKATLDLPGQVLRLTITVTAPQHAF